MKYIVSIFLLLLTTSSIIAEDKVYPAYKIPESSPLTIGKIVKIPPFLYFKGEVEVVADYQFHFYKSYGNENLVLYIYPIQESTSLLPYLTERGKPEVPNKIIIHDQKDALKKLLGKALVQDMLESDNSYYSGKAKFIIYGFGGGFECDTAVFLAKIKSVLEVLKKPVAIKLFNNDGC